VAAVLVTRKPDSTLNVEIHSTASLPACIMLQKFAVFGLEIKLLSFLIILYVELSTNVSWLAYFISTKTY